MSLPWSTGSSLPWACTPGPPALPGSPLPPRIPCQVCGARLPLGMPLAPDDAQGCAAKCKARSVALCPLVILSCSRVCQDSVARVFRIPTDGSGKSHIYQSRSDSVRPRGLAVPRGRSVGPLCRLVSAAANNAPPFLDKGGKHRRLPQQTARSPSPC